jgi:hypothetical protein
VLLNLFTAALLDKGFNFDRAEAIVAEEDAARAAIEEALMGIAGFEEEG